MPKANRQNKGYKSTDPSQGFDYPMPQVKSATQYVTKTKMPIRPNTGADIAANIAGRNEMNQTFQRLEAVRSAPLFRFTSKPLTGGTNIFAMKRGLKGGQTSTSKMFNEAKKYLEGK
jgi:hypothetical protein